MLEYLPYLLSGSLALVVLFLLYWMVIVPAYCSAKAKNLSIELNKLYSVSLNDSKMINSKHFMQVESDFKRAIKILEADQFLSMVVNKKRAELVEKEIKAFLEELNSKSADLRDAYDSLLETMSSVYIIQRPAIILFATALFASSYFIARLKDSSRDKEIEFAARELSMA